MLYITFGCLVCLLRGHDVLHRAAVNPCQQPSSQPILLPSFKSTYEDLSVGLTRHILPAHSDRGGLRPQCAWSSGKISTPVDIETGTTPPTLWCMRVMLEHIPPLVHSLACLRQPAPGVLPALLPALPSCQRHPAGWLLLLYCTCAAGCCMLCAQLRGRWDSWMSQCGFDLVRFARTTCLPADSSRSNVAAQLHVVMLPPLQCGLPLCCGGPKYCIRCPALTPGRTNELNVLFLEFFLATNNACERLLTVTVT